MAKRQGGASPLGLELAPVRRPRHDICVYIYIYIHIVLHCDIHYMISNKIYIYILAVNSLSIYFVYIHVIICYYIYYIYEYILYYMNAYFISFCMSSFTNQFNKIVM